jgi:predicted nucleic acid-binding protein
VEAAEILATMRQHEHYETTKIRELSFDVLIALSARSIGATVITCNASDYRTIRKYLSFHLLCWD